MGDEGSEHEVENEGREHGNSESNEDLGVHEKDQPTLHFIDCIAEGEQKCDANVVLSCFEAALHALRSQFPHVKKLIMQKILLESSPNYFCLMFSQLLVSNLWLTTTMKHKVGKMFVIFTSLTSRPKPKLI